MARLPVLLFLICLCFSSCENKEEPKVEICNNGIDDDNDSFTDCDDADCYNSNSYECNCDDGIDNDNDSFIDCDDLDCANSIVFECDCSDGVDNDDDAFIDCDDADCDC